MKRRLLSLILLTVFTANTVLYSVTQVDAAQSMYADDYKYSVQTTLDSASAALSRNASGNYGLLYDLRNLVRYAQYVAYAVSYSGSGATNPYTNKEAEYYTQYLRANVSVFNERFGEDTVHYKALKLDELPEKAEAKDVIAFVDKLTMSAVDYIDATFKEVEGAKNGAGAASGTSGSAITSGGGISRVGSGGAMSDAKFNEEYGVLCKNLYMSLSVIVDTCDEIRDLRSNAFKASYSLTDIVTCVDAIEKIITEHNELYSIGESLANAESSGDFIAVDETKQDLENLATVTVDEGGKIHAASEPTLDINYLAILAAGSVYKPFTSYVGDATFTKALQSLVTNGSEASKLLTLYNNNKTLKKPLYKRELDSTGSPTGVADLITLPQFISDIESGAVGALVTIKGSFEYDAPSSSWLYRPETKNLATLDAYSDTLIYNSSELEITASDTLQGVSSMITSNDSEDDYEGSESGDAAGGSAADSAGESGSAIGSTGGGADSETGDVSVLDGLRDSIVLDVEASSVDNITGSSIGGSTDSSSDTGVVEIQGAIGETENGDADDTNDTDTDAGDSSIGVGITSDDSTLGNGEESGSLGTDSSSGNAAIVDTSKALYAYDSISTVDRMTGPVLLYGTTYARDVDNMTTMILTNIFSTAGSALESSRSQSTEFLYMNPFGDIVTQDDLVILPGIANPLMYQHDGTYNPFTVAFMNSYPSILNNTSYFQLSSKTDIGKYLVFLQQDRLEGSDVQLNDDGEVSDVDMIALDQAIKNYNNGAELGNGVSLSAGVLSSRHDVKQSAPIRTMNIATDFISNSYDTYSVFAIRRLVFGADSNWNEKNPLFTYTPLIIDNNLVINGRGVFPYRNDTDVDYSIACAIADNMFQFLTVDRVSGEIGNCGKLNDNWILHFMLINNSEGTNNTRGYTDSLLFQYTKYAEDAANRAVLRLVDLSHMLINGTTNIDGVIGIKNSYEDPILGKVLLFVRQYWLFALLMFILLLLIAFARFKRDLFQTVVIFTGSLLAAVAFVLLIPVYLPMAYNVVLNNLSDTFSYKILAQRAEYLDVDDSSAVELDNDGEYKYNTGSITLYRRSSLDLENMYGLLGIDSSDASAGSTYVINSEAGTFLQGDSIKMNTDTLFKTLKIDGSVDADSVYRLESKKTVSNNMDYYTPYYQIVDGFIDKLNSLSEVYSIPESTKTYGNGKSKNNYLVYCYLNSQPFLNAGENYHYELPVDRTGWSNEDIEAYESMNEAVCLQLEEVFGDNIDWLGISDLFFNQVPQYGSKYQNSLWLRTLIQNGYYKRGEDGVLTPDTEMLESLVTYVNYQTKHFVLGMEDQIGVVSDDVMIKIISLRALVALNQKASNYSNWLYPFSINYPEFSLDDILSCMFIKDFDKYIASGMDIVEYVRNEYGWFHLVIFDLVTLLMFLITSVMKILVACMYLAFAGIVMFRLSKTGEINAPIKGYVKCMGLIMVCSTVLCLSVTFLQRLNYSVISLYALLFIIMLIMYVLTSIVSALMSNFMDLGSEAIVGRLTGGLRGFRGSQSSRFNRVSVRHAGVGRRYRQPVRSNYGMRRRPSFSNYSINRSYNDYYGYGSGYNSGYGSGYDSGYGSGNEIVTDNSSVDIAEEVRTNEEVTEINSEDLSY